ncbi:MAG: hypothetical protein IJE46_02720 [Clostridia bacterium]|nr:hypothetical protein [Clostridia bacterium]
MTKCAVIDLGSNSIRMGFFEKKNGNLVQTERFREQVRISEGLASDNLLKDEPVKRTLSAIKRFKGIIDQRDIKNVKIVATEALRRANNSDVFTSLVKKDFGIDVLIIDGLKEAEYDVLAAKMSAEYESFYMIDTGGGSVEIALVCENKIKEAVCLPLGSVVMTENFGTDRQSAENLEIFIESELKKTGIIVKNSFPVVALGGSNKELAKIGLCDESETNIDGYKMSVQNAKDIYKKLKSMTFEERKSVKGLDVKRADTIVAGLCPIVTLLNLSGTTEICFCTGSVREGVAAGLLL